MSWRHPKNGTKSDKWTRLEKRENELVRERKSQAVIAAEREAGGTSSRSSNPDVGPP